MAKKSEKEVLEVGVNVEKALQDMAKMERATKRNFSEVAKAVDKLNGVNKKAAKQAEDGNDRWQASLEELTKTYKEEGKAIEDVMDTIDLLAKKASKQNDEDKKATLAEIDRLKKVGAAKIKSLRGKEGKEGRVMARGMFKDASKELGDTLKDTLSAVFVSKDVKSALENSAKSLVKGLKLSAAGGMKLNQAGSGLIARGRDRGGMGGLAMKSGGAAMKGLGSLMGGIKPLIETLTKIGPILGAIGGAALSLVKIFLDMDAKVKDFNKDLLVSAGNADFLARAGGNTDVAFGKMSKTLDGIRDAAYEWSNIDLGISPDDYKAIVNTLNQEGVSIARIGNEADRTGQSVKEFTSDLAHVSVAYSRAFGVPLQEINTLQAEMMTEMGADLKQTQQSFEQMNRAAQDSGISANKFFGMIRGVSQDLSLWGTRMEDAVKLLGRLGQVMSPRNAQKFMQSATQGLKNMGRTERLRLSLLTGQGKMGKLVDRDIKRKSEGLAKSFGMTADEVMSKLKTKEGRGELEGKIQRMDPSQQGALREALVDAQLQADRRKKGTFGTATAARNLGPAAALEAMQGALVKFGGGKKLSDIVGTIGGEMMAENLGISEEQLDQMAKFESSIDNQREVLKKQLLEGTDAQKEAARNALKKADIQGKDDKELAENIDKAGYDSIMDTLTDSQKLEAKGASDAEIMSAKQADLQTSMLGKLDAILNWLMNQIYDVLMGLWDTILSFPFVGSEKKQLAKISDSGLRKAATADDPSKALMNTRAWKDLMDGLDKSSKTNPKQFQSAVKAMSDNLGAEKLISAAKMAGIDSSKLDAFTQALPAAISDDMSNVLNQKEIDQGSSDAALKTFTPEEIVQIMKKASIWTGTGIEKAGTIDAGIKALGITPNNLSASSSSPGVTQPSGGGPAATPSAPPAPPEIKEQAAAVQDTLSVTKEQASTMASIDNQMDKFKMDTSFLSGPYSKAVEGSVLKAVRTALFEYYMYKDLNPQTVIDTMRGGGYTPSTIGSAITDMSLRTGGSPEISAKVLQGHATGGMVTGVSDGLARVTAAAGEGLASVGPGERIVPAAGRGGGGLPPINVSVPGVGGDDLRKIIEAKVIDGIHEYKRRERFH
jgi:hypothetical protein